MCAPVLLCGVLSELYWRLHGVFNSYICFKTKCSCNHEYQILPKEVFTKLRYCKIYTIYFTSIQSIFCIHTLLSYAHLYIIYMSIVKTVYIVYSRFYQLASLYIHNIHVYSQNCTGCPKKKYSCLIYNNF
jgi:hypothetical protein